jgi:outer membrane protein assembly factor BamB
VYQGKAYLVHDTGILAVLNARTGEQIYKVRVGGGGHTFSASPVAAGNRIYLLDENGVTFVLDSGDRYNEIAKNDLGEMTLASPAIAAGAMYVRTESRLYRIGRL